MPVFAEEAQVAGESQVGLLLVLDWFRLHQRTRDAGCHGFEKKSSVVIFSPLAVHVWPTVGQKLQKHFAHLCKCADKYETLSP